MAHRKFLLYFIGWGALLICLGSACNKTIDLNLPPYSPKLVIEFYLEDGQPLRCALQESVPYTALTPPILIEDALVILSYNDVQDTLKNEIFIDEFTGKAYNYFNPKLLRAEEGTIYRLYVRDRQGREMHAETQFIPTIPIDSMAFTLNEEEKASVGLIFNDPPAERNYYRLVAFPDRDTIPSENNWDIRLSDLVFNGEKFSFFTGFSYAKTDSVVGRLYHLTLAHYNFLESAQNARDANGNPFAQPANIRSNVSGGIGIFTAVSFEQARIIITDE